MRPFYKWTQWIFVQMFKKGLAYEKEFPINWCPSCKTGLANEEVVNGCCERCGTPVTKKNLRQWMLKITAYADRLLNDLDKLDWPEKVKKMQTDWIGKSYGAEVDFGVEGRDEKITVYTTRPDTLYGATFMVLAPEHAMAKSLATDETREAVEKYIFDSSMRSNVDRLQDKEKTGVFTGTYAINPINGAKVPIWLSDYVLADYGTGAIMCVPAHDDRDFEFAKKFNIPIIQVIAKDGKEIENMTEAYTEASGTMINSGEWNGMESSVLKKEAPEMIEKRGIGHKRVNYKLRDWVFSRQRYWGEPIPIVHCPKCGNVPVPEDHHALNRAVACNKLSVDGNGRHAWAIIGHKDLDDIAWRSQEGASLNGMRSNRHANHTRIIGAHDRAAGGKRIAGGAGRRRHDHTIAAQAIDMTGSLRRGSAASGQFPYQACKA